MTHIARNGIFAALWPATVIARFSKEPLAADLFAWCSETGTFPHIRWSLSALGVPFEPSETLANLRAKIERCVIREENNIKRKAEMGFRHDINGLVAFKQMLATIEQFKRSA